MRKNFCCTGSEVDVSRELLTKMFYSKETVSSLPQSIVKMCNLCDPAC